MSDTQRASVVLVHGGFVDGSGWQGVYAALRADGYDVGVVQNPTLTLQQDAAFTRQILDGLGGPAVLVGHSYGGAVITEAGTHPNVAALVYVAAFAPDTGRVGRLSHRRVPGRRAAAADPAAHQRLPLPRPQAVPRLVRGRPARRAGRVHGRRPGPVGGGGHDRAHHRGRLAHQAELVPHHHRGQDDPAAAQAAMADRIGARVSQAAASHAVYVSQPEAVVAVIAEAAAQAAGR